MDSMKKQWTDFLFVIGTPWSLLLIICIVLLCVYTVILEVKALEMVFTIMLSLFSAVLGGLWLERWSQIREKGELVSKGKSAVRSLKLQLHNIVSLESRVGQFIDKITKAAQSVDLIKAYFDEVKCRCALLAENTMKSIEDWKDVTPEADIGSQIGIISHLESRISKGESELSSLMKKIESEKGKSQSENSHLKRELEEKEREISMMKEELSRKSFGFNKTDFINAIQDDLAGYSEPRCKRFDMGEPKEAKFTTPE